MTHNWRPATNFVQIMQVYWKLGENNSKVPDKWPSSYATIYNKGIKTKL